MSPDSGKKNDSGLWYKDAVIYQLHVKTFHDITETGWGISRGCCANSIISRNWV